MKDDSLVDIDAQPDVLVEILGRVEVEQISGRPRFVPLDAARWLAELRHNVGHAVRLALIRQKRVRTNPQNRFLWGVVYAVLLEGFRHIAADSGEQSPFRTKQQVHEAMKYRFLGVTVIRLPGGEEMDTPATTTLLTTVQFNTYWRAIARWAAERYSIYIPEPGETVAA